MDRGPEGTLLDNWEIWGVSTDELALHPCEFLGFNNVLCFREILTFREATIFATLDIY